MITIPNKLGSLRNTPIAILFSPADA